MWGSIIFLAVITLGIGSFLLDDLYKHRQKMKQLEIERLVEERRLIEAKQETSAKSYG